jgi:hypothetical protein
MGWVEFNGKSGCIAMLGSFLGFEWVKLIENWV